MNKNIQSGCSPQTQRRLVDERRRDSQEREGLSDADRRHLSWTDKRLQEAAEKFTAAQEQYSKELANGSARDHKSVSPPHKQKKIDTFWQLCHKGANTQMPYFVLCNGQLVPVGSAPRTGLLFEISSEGDALRGFSAGDGVDPTASLLSECVCYVVTQRTRHSEPLAVPEVSTSPSLSIGLPPQECDSPVNLQEIVDRLMHLVSTIDTHAVDIHLPAEAFGSLHIHIMQKYGSLCIVINAESAAAASSYMAATPALMNQLVSKHKKVRITIRLREDEDRRSS